MPVFRAVAGGHRHLLSAILRVSPGPQPEQADGRWLLENTHPGLVYFDLEDGDGEPSRWNTLRALRVLRWYDAA